MKRRFFLKSFLLSSYLFFFNNSSKANSIPKKESLKIDKIKINKKHWILSSNDLKDGN